MKPEGSITISLVFLIMTKTHYIFGLAPTRRYPQFVSRFLNRRNPDRLEQSFLRGTGEFSVDSDLAFEKHLKRIKPR